MGRAFDQTLTLLAEAADNPRDRGTLFEKLIVEYLRTDPQYVQLLENVWLWSEWPLRPGADMGIDLVAQERGTGAYWAVQCKFFDAAHEIKKKDIDSFFTASGQTFDTPKGRRHFSHRLIVSTTDQWSKNAEQSLKDQTIPVSRLSRHDLAQSPIDWSDCRPAQLTTLAIQPKKAVRPHQIAAIQAVIDGFTAQDRGQLIMACGTGKTLTALRLAEQYVPTQGQILLLMPSIALIAQSLREWTAEALTPFSAIAICSDSKVGKDAEDIRLHDMPFPPTTDPKKLCETVKRPGLHPRTVIFSTYQSLEVVEQAQRMGLSAFDLIICDEAHRTTGLTCSGDDPSHFVLVHDNTRIVGHKRLYMTATPRIYAEASKTKAGEAQAVLFSMDNPDIYGPVFYQLGFGQAVEQDLLSEYKVLIVAIEAEKMAALADAYTFDHKKAIDTRFVTKIVGAWKGLSKESLQQVDAEGNAVSVDVSTAEPMRRAVAFSKSIKDSKEVTTSFNAIIGKYQAQYPQEIHPLVDCALDHVDGTMHALKRQSALDWLRTEADTQQCRILSNARCLSEGVDVPALDAVIFFDTRESMVDIVQSVGRVMRKAPGKQYGYIILPVCMPSDNVAAYNTYMETDPQFRGIWKVLKALRAHDESLVDQTEFRKKIQIIGAFSRRKTHHQDTSVQMPLPFPPLPLDAICDAVYAIIPDKLGHRKHWSDWAKDVARMAEVLIARIHALLERPAAKAAFDRFLLGLHQNVNPAVTVAEAVEMLAQHTITQPIFEALFADKAFTAHNPVSKAMAAVLSEMDEHAVSAETRSLQAFYEDVQARIRFAKSEDSRQEIIRNLYDTFFNTAFPRMAARLGIVYTPIPVVDFIVRSAEHALRTHFGRKLSDQGVHVLDPFSGTGTFMVRLLQLGLIAPEDLHRKFTQELHANEMVLLAYYIAAINIESSFQARSGTYQPFEGMVLTDTFQMTETRDLVDQIVLPENSARVTHQNQQPVQVIIGNPPYSAGQTSANDDAQNLEYKGLDQRIADTYLAKSLGKGGKRSSYDSYIRAMRWASDRIGQQGLIAFVTNGSFIDSNASDGLRLSLLEEFSHVYVLNLRGNGRTSGETCRKEGHPLFAARGGKGGSLAPIAITLLIKDPAHKGTGVLHYHDIGDYLTREQKLEKLCTFSSMATVPWQQVTPNAKGDWINHRSSAFETFCPLRDKSDTAQNIFTIHSLGVVSGRDTWVYNYAKAALSTHCQGMIAFYNAEIDRYKAYVDAKGPAVDAQSFVQKDTTRISWGGGNWQSRFARYQKEVFEPEAMRVGLYRPFTKMWHYGGNTFNHSFYSMPKLFPTPAHSNVVISTTGVGANKEFSALVASIVPDLEMISKGQCFPLYFYEKAADPKAKGQVSVFDTPEGPDVHGYVRREAITDSALRTFRAHYHDDRLAKEDLFWYVYGILHAPDYRARFAADLKKQLPRVPFAADFWDFSTAGRALGQWHLEYETVEPYALDECTTGTPDFRVTHMAFGKTNGKPDKSIIIYNAHLTLRGIPPEAYNYVVNGKSAIAWIMERYRVNVDKDSGLVNDPNGWSNDPRYMVDLLKRVVRVSVESVRIVGGLPAWEG